MTLQQQRNTVLAIMQAVVQTIDEMGSHGCPAGPLYAALMCHGISYEAFTTLINALVGVKVITRWGNVYRTGPAADTLLRVA